MRCAEELELRVEPTDAGVRWVGSARNFFTTCRAHVCGGKVAATARDLYHELSSPRMRG